MKDLTIITQILQRVEDEIKLESHKPYEKGKFNASGLGGCPRAIQYSMLKTKAEKLTPETIILMKDGNLHEESVKDLFSRIGTISCSQMRVFKKYKYKGHKITISGIIDFIFNHKYVVDVKGINTFSFRNLEKQWPDEYDNYMFQLQVYMDILNMDWAILAAKNKNDSELVPIIVKRNEFILNRMLDGLVRIIEAGDTLIDRPYTRNDWHCKYCVYRLPCWKLPMEGKRWFIPVADSRAREGTKDRIGQSIESALRQSVKEIRKV